MKDPQRWGLQSICVKEELELIPDSDKPFPVNVDGSTFMAERSMLFKRVGKVPLIASRAEEAGTTHQRD